MTITTRGGSRSPQATLPPDNTLYRALVERDRAFEGIFVAAVRTTGIFCRPTCPARKPNRENVEFFSSAADALAHGYRPCKVCRPMEPAGSPPDWLASLLDEVHADPRSRLKDRDLRARGLDPTRVRRWFNRHHGMTFHAYCRLLRLANAFGRIRTGDVVTVARIGSPLGPMLAGATDEGICLLEFGDRRMLETQLARLKGLLGAEVLPGTSPHTRQLEAQLAEYFAGSRRSFDLPLVLRGTPFQKAAWEALLAIPYGETRSYRDQAEAIGRPSAVRAVGRANGDNRIAIVVPCHRVVGADGRLTGYGGGLWRKRFLLDHEMRHAAR